jgi:hypothetical protein
MALTLWIGSIPPYLDEPAALQELGLYGVRPYKLILRQKAPSLDCSMPVCSHIMFDGITQQIHVIGTRRVRCYRKAHVDVVVVDGDGIEISCRVTHDVICGRRCIYDYGGSIWHRLLRLATAVCSGRGQARRLEQQSGGENQVA